MNVYPDHQQCPDAFTWGDGDEPGAIDKIKAAQASAFRPYLLHPQTVELMQRVNTALFYFNVDGCYMTDGGWLPRPEYRGESTRYAGWLHRTFVAPYQPYYSPTDWTAAKLAGLDESNRILARS